MGPSPAVRRFELRLRIWQTIHAGVSAFDLTDVLLVVSLAFVFIGLASPSAAFAVVGFLLLPLTPIWTNVVRLIRGR